jgi:UDP-glucose:(heptosyl)LPS alpha-1,3-glucosyltransferase
LQPVKIALVHKRLDLKGGTERDLFKTAEGLRDLGHEVHLFCSEYSVPVPRGALAHRVPVVPLGRTAELWSFALAARKPIRDSRCDVVVNFGRLVAADILRFGGATHRSFLLRMGVEGGTGRCLWQSISGYHRSVLAVEKRQFNSDRLKKIIAVSQFVKRDIMSNYGVAGEKISVLYNGVDHELFHPARRSEFSRLIRARWKIPPDAPLVLFVGSGFRRKGLDRVISLWSSKKLAEFYLFVVGTDARIGRYRAWAESVAPGRIVFTGRQDDIENYFAAADLVVLLSLQEAFGNVVLESLAAGLPVLVSRDVGASELLTGSLVEGIVDGCNEPKDLEAKLVSLMARSKDAALTDEARRIGEEYSWDRHFHRLDAILRETCSLPPLTCDS